VGTHRATPAAATSVVRVNSALDAPGPGSAFGNLEGGPEAYTPGDHPADELVDRAVLALAEGKPERARKLLTRALEFPMTQESRPANSATFMVLHAAVNDAAEDSTPDETEWVDAAEEVLAKAGGVGLDMLRTILDIAGREGEFEISEATERRLERLSHGAPEGDEWVDQVELDADSLIPVLRLALDYTEAYERRRA
jgi:hypothetical protein